MKISRNKKIKSQYVKARDCDFGAALYFEKILKETVRGESLNLYKQLEAHNNLLARLNGRVFLPPMRGWAISPDFANLMIDLVEKNKFDLCIEFGSGVSTLILSNIFNSSSPYADVFGHLAFEGSLEFFEKTQKLMLEGETKTKVIHAPLGAQVVTDGMTYPYYDCEGELRDLVYRAEMAERKLKSIYCVVDGPPASVAKKSRYPALYFLMKFFPQSDLHILLDDYIREDEKEIADKWMVDLNAAGYEFSHEEFTFEKGAIYIVAKPTSKTALSAVNFD